MGEDLRDVDDSHDAGCAPWRDRLAERDDTALRDLDIVLGASQTIAVILDRRGRIVAHNGAWVEAAEAGGLDPAVVGFGVDYLAACDSVTGPDAHDAAAAAHGIRSVLAGEQRAFSLDYECSSPDRRRWFTLRAAQLSGPGSGALITHVEITHVREIERGIRARIDRLWNAVESPVGAVADFVFLLDDEGAVIGRTDDESREVQWPAPGEGVFGFIHPADAEVVLGHFLRCRSVAGSQIELRFRAQGPDGEGWRHFQLSATNMLDDPEVGGIVAAVVDETERVRAVAKQSLVRTLVESLPATALVTDDDRVVLAANSGASHLLGVPAERLLGQALPSLATGSEDATEELIGDLASGRSWEGEMDVNLPDGEVARVWLRAERFLDPATGQYLRSYLALDRNEQRELRETVDHERTFDPVTGLINRAEFLRQLDRSLDSDQRQRVAVVSLDRFRDLNRIHGAAAGDDVLRTVGQRLAHRAGRNGVVTRLYGDVFAVLSSTEPDELAARLRRAISEVRTEGGVATGLTSSIGIRELHGGTTSSDIVVDEALAAAAEVKAEGGNGFRAFDADLRRELGERTSLSADLAVAVARGELSVEYQPLVRLDDGSVGGVEALVRWDHPRFGRIPPDRFIPLAERSAVIHEIGAFVLDDACRHASRWRDLRPEVPVTVAVNVSPAQLRDPNLVARFADALQRHHLDPSLITVELTESMLMDDVEACRQQIRRLKAAGVLVAVDDFGTGHSSLARMKSLPIDVLKVDRSFVHEVSVTPENASIITMVLGLAATFGTDVIAEGVETMDDARRLRELGCLHGQGFLWSPPVPAEEIDRMLLRPFPCAPTPETGTEAVDRFEAYSDALRAIQHELATPLAILNVSAGMRDGAGAIPREVHGTISRSAQRLSRMVESLDLLDRLDRGRLEVRRSEVELVELCRTVATEIAHQTCRLIDVVAPPTSSVFADAALLEQVVVNLLTNAVKYSPDGAPVTVLVHEEASLVRIEVHDRGPGIPTERLGTVWRKFGRLDHAAPGSGLGLYLARGIARAHGGELRYREAEPSGSVFVLEVPRRSG